MSEGKAGENDVVGCLRAWRDELGLYRSDVVARIRVLDPSRSNMDQATLAKWESGATPLRVADLVLLAKVYDVAPESLFSPPIRGAHRIAAIRRAHRIIQRRKIDFVEQWLSEAERHNNHRPCKVKTNAKQRHHGASAAR